MENLKDILYDDVEQKFIELQDKKKKRKQRWKRMKYILFFGGIIIGSAYFLSDYSKVKSLSVSGNLYYSDSDILNMADLSYETRYIIMPKVLIQWNLGKSDIIESVDVFKTINGAIHLEVKEKKALGYYIGEDAKTYLVIASSPLQKVEVSEEDKDSLLHYPLLTGFDDEQLQNLVNAFNQNKREVGVEMISMISEMTPYKRSYDENMVKFTMQDGNTIFSSYDAVPLLNDYKAVLRKTPGNHVCLDMDENTASITSTAECK